MGLAILSRVNRRRSKARTDRLRRLATERARRCRARARAGLICFTSELDCRGLEWLVRINAMSEADADNPNPRLVAQAVGRAVTLLIGISAQADQ